MTTCAVVDSANNVINVIIAEPTDLAPQNCVLIEVPDKNGVRPGPGWIWSGETFIDPNPADYSDYSYGN